MRRNISTTLAFAAMAMFLAVGCADKSTKVQETPGDKAATAEPAKAEPSKPKITDETVKAPAETPSTSTAAADDKKSAKTGPAKEEVVAKASADTQPSALKVVYFDYDKSNITDEAKTLLDKNFEYLTKNGNVKVTIVGHCDERGTAEYNMALGDRRANSTKNYLANRGITAPRMDTLSKGKEEPVDPGHSEAAWAKNRRAEFKTRN